jgi:VWFA-related protein
LLDVLNSVATALKGDASERRTVVVVSEGRLALDPERDTDRDMLQDYRDVVRAAALSNIVVHGVDPRGLLAPQPAPATGQQTSVEAARGMAENRAASNAARRFGALGLVAASTGGQMVIDHNAPDAGLSQVIRESRQYYRLAYIQSDIPPGDRARPRTITVRVAREDVQVRARSAYVPR